MSGGTAEQVWLAHLRGAAAPPARPLSDAEWSGLVGLAERHRVAGLTYRRLADGPLAGRIPGAQAERLRAAYAQTAFRNALMFRQTAELLRALAARGIETMLLKGIHLARFVYPEPGLRSMADVDLMVRRDRLAEAEAVALELGYGPLPRPDLEQFCSWSNHLAKLEKDGAPVIELHWAVERPTSPFRIDHDALWARSAAAELEGVPVRLLSPEDLLLHLVLHGSYHHHFDRSALKGLVDLQAVVTRHQASLDWDLVARRAGEWGAGCFAYVTLRLAAEVLDVPVPAAVLGALPHGPADDEMVGVARRFVLTPVDPLPEPYVELARDHTLGERLLILLRGLFLPRRRMEEVYGLRPGSPLVFPYYLGRGASLVVRRTGLLIRTLFRRPGVRPVLDHDQDRLRIERWVGQVR